MLLSLIFVVICANRDELKYMPDVKQFEKEEEWESTGFDAEFGDDFDTNGLLGIEVFTGDPDQYIFSAEKKKGKGGRKKEVEGIEHVFP